MLDKTIECKFSVVKAVEEELIRLAKANDRNNKVFHPSEWDVCHRQIAYKYYEATGVIKIDDSAMVIDPQLQRIFDCGHSMHDRWKRYLGCLGNKLKGRWRCMNWFAHQDKPKIYGDNNTLGIFKPDICECGSTRFEYEEVGFYDSETNWGGHVDGILNLNGEDIILMGCDYPPVDVRHIVVDFKTMNPHQFKNLTEPLPKHKTQMQIYLYLSKLRMGKFLYENKADQAVKEFNVYRDDTLIEVKKSEAVFLRSAVTRRKSDGTRALPKQAFMSAGEKECVRCKFRGHCWKLETQGGSSNG